MRNGKRGFTIVELLIVIVVIGILAAITIVSYNGIQNRSYDTAVQSDLAALSKKFELYKIDHASNLYPYGVALGASTTPEISVAISRSAYQTTGNGYNLLNCTSSASPGSNYAILTQSKSGKYFWISSTTNSVQQHTGSVSLVNVNSCSIILSGSIGSGAGYDSTNGWRPWTAGS